MSPGPVTRLLPPSGVDWLACSADPLAVDDATRWVVLPGCGAVVTFTGTVRDHSPGHSGVRQLDYEAYEQYVVPGLQTVAGEVRARFPHVGRLVLWHRVGSLAVTDAAVVVAVSTPHRAEAFAAASWAIDEVKATVPIWKREHSDQGLAWVRCDHTHDAGHRSEPAPGRPLVEAHQHRPPGEWVSA